MIQFNKQLALRDEIRIGFECVKNGLQKLQELRGMPADYYIPYLLLGNGLERILKVLICFHEYETNQKFPSSKKMMSLSHSLTKSLNEVVSVCEQYPLYNLASARVQEIDFIKNNVDFLDIIKMISDFLESSRYYNLNVITENKQNTYKSPHDILIDFRSTYSQRNPDVQNLAWQSDLTQFYTNINSYLIEVLQRFIRFLSLCFTQGAFGSFARQFSASLLDPFLTLDDSELRSLKF